MLAGRHRLSLHTLHIVKPIYAFVKLKFLKQQIDEAKQLREKENLTSPTDFSKLYDNSKRLSSYLEAHLGHL